MATDAKCVENLAGLSEIKGLKSSSRVAGRGQHDVLEFPTAAGPVLFRRGVRKWPRVSDCRKRNRRIGACPETHAEHVAERTI